MFLWFCQSHYGARARCQCWYLKWTGINKVLTIGSFAVDIKLPTSSRWSQQVVWKSGSRDNTGNLNLDLKQKVFSVSSDWVLSLWQCHSWNHINKRWVSISVIDFQHSIIVHYPTMCYYFAGQGFSVSYSWNEGRLYNPCVLLHCWRF